jgi:uncharacterized protein
MATVITQELVAVLRSQFRIRWDGIHGVRHWSRVRLYGLRLARETGARTDVVEWFAFLHDAAREAEGFDHGHGTRAVALARDLRGPLLPIDDSGFDLLSHAMTHHSDGFQEGDATVRTCWDADRLDLPRVGIDPDPERLCTAPAQRGEFIAWARKRAQTW